MGSNLSENQSCVEARERGLLRSAHADQLIIDRVSIVIADALNVYGDLRHVKEGMVARELLDYGFVTKTSEEERTRRL
jgi:hypothetical protein